MNRKKTSFNRIRILLVSGLFLVATIAIIQQTKNTKEGGFKILGSNETRQGNEQINTLNNKKRIAKTKDNLHRRNEDNFIINKKLSDANENKINFPERCAYKERSMKDSLLKGFALIYTSEKENCPSVSVRSKNIKIKEGHWGLTWLERKDGKIRHFYGDKKQQWKKVEKNIFKSTVYTNIECSSFIDTSIVYDFPKNSILDFADIQTSDREGEFKEGDYVDICEPKQSIIDTKINQISKKEHLIEVELLQKMFENK